MVKRRIEVVSYTGLDVKSPRTLMGDGFGRMTGNFDFRRRGAARVRAGYSRLIAPSSSDVTITYERSSVFTDTFDGGSNGQLLKNRTGWTAAGLTDDGLLEVLVSAGAGQVALHSLNSIGASCKTTATLDNNQFAGFTVKAHATYLMGVCVRIDTIGGYLARPVPGGVYLYRFTLASGAVLPPLKIFSATVAVNDTIFLEAVGSTLYVYHNSTLLGTASDSTHPSGAAGVYFDEATGGTGYGPGRLDNFECGDMDPVSHVVPVVVTAPSRLYSFERDDNQNVLLVGSVARVDYYLAGQPEWD